MTFQMVSTQIMFATPLVIAIHTSFPSGKWLSENIPCLQVNLSNTGHSHLLPWPVFLISIFQVFIDTDFVQMILLKTIPFPVGIADTDFHLYFSIGEL